MSFDLSPFSYNVYYTPYWITFFLFFVTENLEILMACAIMEANGREFRKQMEGIHSELRPLESNALGSCQKEIKMHL